MNRTTVHVALYDDWADWELGFLTPRIQDRLYQRDPGRLQIRTFSATTDPVRSMGGLTAIPDLVASDVSPASSAMLVLPGAGAWEGEEGIPWAAALARRFVQAGVPVAAICGGVFGLARSGLLDDREHTGAAREYLATSGYAGGDHYVDADVVTDRGVITAGPVDALPFARAALELLDIYDPDVLNAWYRVFTEHDVEAYGVLARTAEDQARARARA